MAGYIQYESQPLIDFCDSRLGTTVISDKISSDGYEVDNLISVEFWKKQNGFMSERFIKPPINLTFHFPCPISIWRIIVDPVVGSQKSSSIGIHLKGHRALMDLGKLDMSQPAKICFHDPKYVPSTSASRLLDLNCFKYCGQLRHIRQLYNASHITVKICQTLSGSVGAVKSVEIWGQPTKWCNKELVRKVYERYKCGVGVSRNSHYQSQVGRVPQNIDIPDEFLDPLSCDIMTIPMLLPSGRNVDKSSLDKFIDIEASWGRQPSDPFTGVAFTAKSFPIPNDALKGRIDHFLISNESSGDIQTLPRTVST
ncbi:hypothetical protein LOTGIDRAFT_188023, partial [Lottia gigantea]